jgi:hypothetical protein
MQESRKPVRRALLRVLAGAGVAVAITATGFAATGSAPAEALHELRITDGKVPADEQLIAARKGDRLRLRIVSNTGGELHLHAYRLSVRLAAGQPADLTFDAFATGRFKIEWHPAEGHEGVGLATLEVRPT